MRAALAIAATGGLIASCGPNLSDQGKANASNEVVEPVGVSKTVADVEAEGLVDLGGPITGLTAPTTSNHQIAEGSPKVSMIYFGVAASGGKPEVRRYACKVPEEHQVLAAPAPNEVRAQWKCEPVNG